MIRMVGVQRNALPEQEFVLLQNQGSFRVDIRGHILLSDCAIESGDLGCGAHVFTDEALIPAGMYVVLRTGFGEPRWAKTKEGQMVYHAFMNRECSVWEQLPGPIHVLSKQHSFAERPTAVALR